jgi:hypothetical protein
MKNRIFSLDSPKAIKARGFGYLNAIHYMAPADVAGVGNLCPKATASCKALCLGWFSGQAGMVANDADLNSVRKSRIEKAKRFMQDRAGYLADVVRSIELAQKKARKLRKKLCVRLNGSTDIAWEGIACERNGKRFPNLMLAFPAIQFVDYTKIAKRLERNLPENYNLTLSRTEKNEKEVVRVIASGFGNAAVVFKSVPATYLGFPVINGDEHDLRHLDPQGVIVGLTPKGSKAKRDISGFVVV